MFLRRFWWFVFISSFGQFACAKDDLDSEHPQEKAFTFRAPDYFPIPVDMIDNPLSKDGIELGRYLFYEPLLSGNQQVSCATCHHPEKAFSDGLITSNTGISGKALERHSPALFNLMWSTNGLFWDGGAKNLESQAFAPLTHPDEMGVHFPTMVARLAEIPSYVEMFRHAFDEAPSSAGIAKALAQFQRSIVSANAPYDQYRSGKNPKALNAQELIGLKLVQSHCASCHEGELFTDNAYHNNGLDATFEDDSHEEVFFGRFRVTRDKKDLGAYKTPSLRNIMVTAPYMHDGRFASINDVLNHYRFGIKRSAHTDPVLLAKMSGKGIPLSDADVDAIKAFLHQLTDHEFLNNQQYSNPHKNK
ncbi:cytochrome-c peroxidase [Sphingobacterium corticis]|uniref:Cytochrome-c peroxidase n=1 Tax=Sphingobacterium corticis TaxID=1812823 RepID=A0ABW5NEN8_9SPHI